MKVFNKTGKAIIIVDSMNEIAKVMPPDGTPVELSTITRKIGNILGLPLVRKDIRGVKGLPSFRKNTYFIVNDEVKKAFPNRTDLIIVGDVVKNVMGITLGVQSFSV